MKRIVLFDPIINSSPLVDYKPIGIINVIGNCLFGIICAVFAFYFIYIYTIYIPNAKSHEYLNLDLNPDLNAPIQVQVKIPEGSVYHF